jgi:hypothetical protein
MIKNRNKIFPQSPSLTSVIALLISIIFWIFYFTSLIYFTTNEVYTAFDGLERHLSRFIYIFLLPFNYLFDYFLLIIIHYCVLGDFLFLVVYIIFFYLSFFMLISVIIWHCAPSNEHPDVIRLFLLFMLFYLIFIMVMGHFNELGGDKITDIFFESPFLEIYVERPLNPKIIPPIFHLLYGFFGSMVFSYNCYMFPRYKYILDYMLNKMQR